MELIITIVAILATGLWAWFMYKFFDRDEDVSGYIFLALIWGFVTFVLTSTAILVFSTFRYL